MAYGVKLGLSCWQFFPLADADCLPAVCLTFCLGTGNKRMHKKSGSCPRGPAVAKLCHDHPFQGGKPLTVF